MEKYYIFRYYSNWGMGSDSETALLSEEHLRRIIELELIRKESGSDRYDDRMTGTWSDEVFCDSKDKEEVIADVIKKRLNTCSTYAGVNDLIVLPTDMVIETRKETLLAKNQREDKLRILILHINELNYCLIRSTRFAKRMMLALEGFPKLQLQYSSLLLTMLFSEKKEIASSEMRESRLVRYRECVYNIIRDHVLKVSVDLEEATSSEKEDQKKLQKCQVPPLDDILLLNYQEEGGDSLSGTGCTPFKTKDRVMDDLKRNVELSCMYQEIFGRKGQLDFSRKETRYLINEYTDSLIKWEGQGTFVGTVECSNNLPNVLFKKLLYNVDFIKHTKLKEQDWKQIIDTNDLDLIALAFKRGLFLNQNIEPVIEYALYRNNLKVLPYLISMR